MHMGSALSGTVEQRPPRCRDVASTGSRNRYRPGSFVEGLCVWEGCDVLATGGSLEDVTRAVEQASLQTGNVFIVRGLTLLRQGGRLAESGESSTGVPVLAYVDGAIRPVGSATTVEEAIAAMVGRLQTAMARNPEKRFRVGVGNVDADELATDLESRIRGLDGISEVVPYLIGPAVGAHTGSGCTGLSFIGRPV